MPHFVTLLFDVEDLGWPESDDITLELATRLSQHKVQGTFFIVGEKARFFAERGRTDIIAALEAHDLGSHGHSIHPTVAEYLADLDWDEGVLTAVEEEEAGFGMLEQIFGRKPAAWGQPGGSWGPQIHAAMARLHTPVVVYAPTRIEDCVDLHWFAGSLVFPGRALVYFDDALTDDVAFEQALQMMFRQLDERVMMGARWSGIFVCHPHRLRAVEFPEALAGWDGLNYDRGGNIQPSAYPARASGQIPTLRSDEAYQTGLKNFDRLVEILKQDRRLEIKTIAELRQIFRPPEETVYLYQIDEAVAEIEKKEDILTHFYHFSPAELLDLVARVYTNPEFALESPGSPGGVRRRPVFGPTSEPLPFYPHGEFVYWADFVAACQMLVNHITYQGRLPASVHLRGSHWSTGAFYRAAMDIWFQFRKGSPPRAVEWKPGYLYPGVGHEIAVTVQDDYEAWPIHQPGLDLNKLLMHTCFQSWTLRPAYKR